MIGNGTIARHIIDADSVSADTTCYCYSYIPHIDIVLTPRALAQ